MRRPAAVAVLALTLAGGAAGSVSSGWNKCNWAWGPPRSARAPNVVVLCQWRKAQDAIACLVQVLPQGGGLASRHVLEAQANGDARVVGVGPAPLLRPGKGRPQLAFGAHWISRTGIRCDSTVNAITCGSVVTRHGFAVSAKGRYTTF